MQATRHRKGAAAVKCLVTLVRSARASDVTTIGRAGSPDWFRGRPRAACQAGQMRNLLADLRDITGPGHVLAEPDVVAGYATDWTRLYTGLATCVVTPGPAAELADVRRAGARDLGQLSGRPRGHATRRQAGIAAGPVRGVTCHHIWLGEHMPGTGDVAQVREQVPHLPSLARRPGPATEPVWGACASNGCDITRTCGANQRDQTFHRRRSLAVPGRLHRRRSARGGGMQCRHWTATSSRRLGAGRAEVPGQRRRRRSRQ